MRDIAPSLIMIYIFVLLVHQYNISRKKILVEVIVNIKIKAMLLVHMKLL